MLKCQYQSKNIKDQWQGFEGRSWERTIIEQCTQMESLLDKIPSLSHSLEQIIRDAYPYALKLTIRESHLSKERFPSEYPYSAEQLLDNDFYPEATD